MKQITALLFFVISFGVNAQSFEGTLVYSMDFEVSPKMANMGLTKEVLMAKMAEDHSWSDTIKITYKQGFYRQQSSSVFETKIIYRSDSNMLYTFQTGEASDICTVTDVSKDLEFKMTGKIPSVMLLDSIVDYKDYKLKVVEVKWKSGRYYYLFSENHFKTSPEDYKGHTYDGFYEYLKLSKAYPIVIVKEAGGVMTVTMSLEYFTKEKVNPEIFEIPILVEDEELFVSPMGKMMRIKE
ncbi:hypothetical protein [Owenweeksia hongkongensis]|uniref:hypothetical protein n=1 Tax=Owenweeksia hongkongensis TaxID=253245 RepID=UPI003A8FD92D